MQEFSFKSIFSRTGDRADNVCVFSLPAPPPASPPFTAAIATAATLTAHFYATATTSTFLISISFPSLARDRRHSFSVLLDEPIILYERSFRKWGVLFRWG